MNVKAYLMHKDIVCMEFLMNDNGLCCKIFNILNKQHLPKSIDDTPLSVNRFLKNRQLCMSRYDVAHLKESDIFEEAQFLPYHFLSPFDCYWVKYDTENMPFSAISFYYQDYEMTDIFTSCENALDELSRDTPNLSFSTPYMCFYVFPEENDMQTGFLLMEADMLDQSLFLQNIYAKYLDVLKGQYTLYKDKLFYMVPNITSETLEFISLEEYMFELELKPENVGMTEEELLLECFQYNDFPNKEHFLASLLALDEKYNINRSASTIGVLRNPDTLEIASIAPLYCYK